MSDLTNRLSESEWQAERAAELEEMRTALRRTQQQLAKAKARTDELVSVTVDACRDAVLAHWKGTVPAPQRDRRRKSAEVALWDTGDWQLSKTTPSYNTDICHERVMRFCDKAQRITEIQRADHPVRECVVVFGGDQVEGLFQFPTQPFEVDATIFDQYVNAARLAVNVVKRALGTYERVTVVPEWGNHGRIGSKRDAVPRSDNIDRMVYELARQLLADESRLTWQECPEDIQRLEIGNYRALVIHGDEIGRNGFAAPGTIVQHVNRWRSGAYPWDFRDVYGHHYHSHMTLPLANGAGSYYQTGSTESDNRYAGIMLAASAIPSQRLHFIDPDEGRVTAEYRVYVDK